MGRFLKGKRFLTLFALTVITVIAMWYWLLPQDRIVLTNQTGSDPATILLDGWRSACSVDDEIHRGSSLVGNMKMNGSCTSEVALFAADNAMQMTTPVAVWTDNPTDVLTMSMSPLLTVPLTAWVLTGIANDPVVNASRADAVYNTMQGGLSFTVDVRDYHNQTSITVAACEDLEALKRAYPPVSSRINAYYLQRVTVSTVVNGATITQPASGRWCENDPNIILIGSWATETLAHELGHAFSLLHADTWAPAQNLMIKSSIPRNALTTGQVFRVNVDSDSRLNKNGTRTGATRSCPDSQTATLRCPAVSFDVQPK